MVAPNGKSGVNPRMTKRTLSRRLVLTHEGARHPFRRTLPPPVQPTRRADDQDLRLFFLSFAAFFICFYSFIF